VLNHLIARVCADKSEQWDTWCNMRLTGRTTPNDADVLQQLRENLEECRDVIEDSVWNPAAIAEDLSSAERDLLNGYLAHNERIAERLLRAARDGTLLYGIRKILPFFIIFHWNRWGISLDEQISLSFYMHEILNPKAG
jgi:hypothetical protein